MMSSQFLNIQADDSGAAGICNIAILRRTPTDHNTSHPNSCDVAGGPDLRLSFHSSIAADVALGAQRGFAMKKLARHLIPILIAVVIGPLIAAVAISMFTIGISIFKLNIPYSIRDAVELFSLNILFAYLLGGVIALLAGIFVSIWMIWREPNAIITIIAAVIATCCYLAIGATGLLGPFQEMNAHSNFLFWLVLAVIAAAGCWLLTRPFLNAKRAQTG
jgi:hypothetical protein